MKIIVGISDMKVSNTPGEVLITYSLGSCIGLVIWDPQVKVGGLLHYMLPESKLDKDRAQKRPHMFGDTGIPALFKAAYELGAVKSRLIVTAVGGSQLLDTAGVFNIGKRNYAIMKKLFERNKVAVAREDIGGTVNRTISLDVKTGRILLKVSGKGEFEL
ncbi:MAG: chemotaxis protein CheD [Desulfobulbaceae bacterium]|uniref:Probable chemoreceptor glutamine deamidase CheD n=1 Tax=Candidatus Desulfobia pelagia TaxID=2841692 RepID=A0A8J6ND22_9BACT|nr:chemotaxis protein CheD [Candidatus Desulfobia pelagia]